MGPMTTDPVAGLRRWADAGGVWQVIDRRAGTVTVGLFRCDGGEQVGVVCSGAAELIEFLGERRSSLDD
jgi:hypothetical protein